jgi:hypothetical protein
MFSHLTMLRPDVSENLDGADGLDEVTFANLGLLAEFAGSDGGI